jgi:hypothetical protein
MGMQQKPDGGGISGKIDITDCGWFQAGRRTVPGGIEFGKLAVSAS